MSAAEHPWAPSGNAAFDAARAGGVIDSAVGFPKTKAEMYETYAFIRKQVRDPQSLEGEGDLKFPAGYMFKNVPEWKQGDLDDPVTWMLMEMERQGLIHCIIGVSCDHYDRNSFINFPDFSD